MNPTDPILSATSACYGLIEIEAIQFTPLAEVRISATGGPYEGDITAFCPDGFYYGSYREL
ncbi:MAG: hypothetical protein QGH51_05205 [Planctomycetota bacterium]|nr:hypothetical protein [Planctomycetota bacterium]MDP6941410.1 hypothetical protein [Planctomycetota bacterium]